MKYFNLKSLSVVANLLASKPKFVFPTKTQFETLDEVCNSIISELAKRNFNAPEIDVEFYSGNGRDVSVDTIRGQDFKICFCDINTYEVNIPQKELTVYDDETSPIFYLYVGKSWEKHKKSFMYCSKTNSRVDKVRKRYIKYKGTCEKPKKELAEHSSLEMNKKRKPFLVYDNDGGKEYDPKGKEPKFFITDDVIIEFTEWLKNNVLHQIINQELPKEILAIFSY